MKPWLQSYLPQRVIGKLAAFFANNNYRPLKNYLIGYFIKRYPVNMQEALESDPFAYPNFNAFFTRALKSEARPIADQPQGFVSPADGTLSQLGAIQSGRIIQAKRHDYTVSELLGEQSDAYLAGSFATIYLAPADYHRVHMPCAGRLIKMRYIPGRLFSVNFQTADEIAGLFARNERVVLEFVSESNERFSVVLVGAMIVGSMETPWARTIGSKTRNPARPQTWTYPDEPNWYLEAGQELGRFKLGSTAILLSCRPLDWDPALASLDRVQFGQNLGSFKPVPMQNA